MSISDEQVWIRQALAGDRAAFGHLVEAYQGPVFNLAYRMLGSDVEAEDAAQEVFLRAFAKLSTYRPDKKFSTWLFSIASHHCIDRLRRRRPGWLSLEQPLPPGSLRSDSPLPEECLLRTEERQVVREVLRELSPGYHAPIVLRYWHELSYEEIAETLGLTVAAVKSRLHRARKQLAEYLVQLEEPGQGLEISTGDLECIRAAGSDSWKHSQVSVGQRSSLASASGRS